MADGREHLSHLLVQDRAGDEEFRRGGGSNPKVRPVEDRAGHGGARLSEAQSAFASGDERRDEQLTEDELRALGTILTLEGEDPAYPLRLDSLQRSTRERDPRRRRPRWLLLSVRPADRKAGIPERATVWVSDEYRAQFLQLFEDYLAKETSTGKPLNNELVANIARIRSTVLDDLWQSDGSPPQGQRIWWEVWLRPSDDGPELLRQFAQVFELSVSERLLRLVDRDVMWVESAWSQMEALPFTAVPVAEIRRPNFIDSIEDLSPEEQAEYVDDLAERLRPAGELQPAVCHLDSGVARTHVLLEGSLAPQDLHTIIGVSGFDQDGHGTKMAGLALLGDAMDRHLIGTDQVLLRHRLESVRILPTRTERLHDPRAYGDVTAQAVALPEITATRRRVFCMPVSTNSDTPGKPGQPTLWSATVDALAVGASVVRAGNELRLLAPPDASAARLLVVSAGNVDAFVDDHLAESDTAAIRDPGQAWNALTVGVHRLQHSPVGPCVRRVVNGRSGRRSLAAQPYVSALRSRALADQARHRNGGWERPSRRRLHVRTESRSAVLAHHGALQRPRVGVSQRHQRGDGAGFPARCARDGDLSRVLARDRSGASDPRRRVDAGDAR